MYWEENKEEMLLKKLKEKIKFKKMQLNLGKKKERKQKEDVLMEEDQLFSRIGYRNKRQKEEKKWGRKIKITIL